MPQIPPRRDRRPLLAVLIAAACLTPSACLTASDESASDESASDGSASEGSASVGSASVVTDSVFERRVVVYVQATPEEIQARRAAMSEEDFYSMADHLMWYRQQALEIIDASGLPRADIDGRGVLHFSVDGVARPYRFEELPTLDLVILYEPGREPMALAPVDLEPSVLERYFAGER